MKKLYTANQIMITLSDSCSKDMNYIASYLYDSIEDNRWNIVQSLLNNI